MNISYNWLKEYLQFDLSPRETADVLTSIGLETGGVEEIQTIKGGLEGLVIGEVLTCTAHPNSDHLHLTTVSIGNGGEPLRIVCGAPNVAAGQKVVVATVGTTLYFGEEPITLKRSKIRGEESFGMICAEDEIGIGTSHDGIIVLPADAPVGTPAKEYYNVKSDWVLEVDITPNRVDAASHYGVARDLAAWLKQAGKPHKLTRPSVDAFAVDKKEGGIEVIVENREACPRYSGLTIRGVTVKESPDWLKNKLLLIGLRPINNIVDITNFVLHETGHPMHAFDAAQIRGNEVVVRTMPEKTGFITLDEQEHKLSHDDLMICNAEEGMCIAGVFGGLHSGVTEKTTDLFLESAYFHPTWVRKTARRQGLSTDSSFRFERGADPNNTVYVLKRAALLVKELAGGVIEGEIRDIYPTPVERARVSLSFDKVYSLIGKDIPKEDIRSILHSLETEIEKESDSGLNLRIPTYRVDVTRDVDVIEDILRIYGYNNVEISDSLKANLSYQTATDRKHKLQTLISEQLTANGFSEIMNNSLTKSAYSRNTGVFNSENNVVILNPLSSELDVLRQTLLFGGLETIAYNQNRKHSDLKFFEFGKTYRFDQTKFNEHGNGLEPYHETIHLDLFLTGLRSPENWHDQNLGVDFYDLKAYVEMILKRINIALDRIEMKEMQDAHMDYGLIYRINGLEIARFGLLSNQVLKHFDIKKEVYYASLAWERLLTMANEKPTGFREVTKFPSVRRDLALVLDIPVRFEDISKIAYAVEPGLLSAINLFDVYQGDKIPQGKKSYAISFVLLDSEKTLTDKVIDHVMNRLIKQFEEKLGAVLR